MAFQLNLNSKINTKFMKLQITNGNGKGETKQPLFSTSEIENN